MNEALKFLEEEIRRKDEALRKAIEALWNVSATNGHYGSGPHCTCSHRERERLAWDAIEAGRAALEPKS